MSDNKPKIRNKKFNDNWMSKNLEDIGEVQMCKRIFKDQTDISGEIPFYKIGTFGNEPDAYISRELFNDYKKRFSYPQKGNILISASGTIGRVVEYNGEEAYFQDSNIVWLKHKTDIADKFLKYFYTIAKWDGIEGSTISRLYNSNINATKINYPNIEEQLFIGAFINNFDELLDKEIKKLQKLKNIKSAMLTKMFPKKGSKVPEIRFKGFSGEWEEKTLNDLCSIITKQTGFDYSATIKPSLLTKKSKDTYSFIQNKDFNGMNINFNTDFYIPIDIAKKFEKICLDCPSLLISISGAIGNVGYYDYDRIAFIGGAVGICKLIDSKIGKLVMHELLSPMGQQYFQSLIKASSHQNITVEDIRNIIILLPNDNKEIEKITEYFNNLDSLIEKQNQKIEKLKQMKKAFIDKMFV